MTDTHVPSESPPKMSPERRRELLGLSDLGRAALESERGPAPTPPPLGATLSPRQIELLSLTPEGRGTLETLGITPVSTQQMSHMTDRRPGE